MISVEEKGALLNKIVFELEKFLLNPSKNAYDKLDALIRKFFENLDYETQLKLDQNNFKLLSKFLFYCSRYNFSKEVSLVDAIEVAYALGFYDKNVSFREKYLTLRYNKKLTFNELLEKLKKLVKVFFLYDLFQQDLRKLYELIGYIVLFRDELDEFTLQEVSDLAFVDKNHDVKITIYFDSITAKLDIGFNLNFYGKKDKFNDKLYNELTAVFS